MPVYKALSPFIALIILHITAAHSQHVKVRSWYDGRRTLLKESYYILKNNPTVKDSLYESYYQNGHLKSKGYFQRNRVTGRWEFYYENGNPKSKGELHDNVPAGHWVYFFESGGKSMEGNIEKDRKEGEWVFYFENGEKKKSGKYIQGKREGVWDYFNEDKSLKAKIEFSDDQEIYTTEYYQSGLVKSKGPVRDGKSNGVWTYYYEDGQIKAEGMEKDGVKEGYWVYYQLDGDMASEGSYANGKENGNWKYYYENGELEAEGENKDGEKDGHWKLYYEDGTFKGEGDFKDGNGMYKEYYESGKLKSEGYVRKGKSEGQWNYYDENGTLEGQCLFTDGKGKYTGVFKNGKKKMEGMIEDGRKVDTWYFYKKNGRLEGKITYCYSDRLGSDSLRPSQKPPLVSKWKVPVPYVKRTNEYKDFLLAIQPFGILKNHFGISLEYYYQERLGFELGTLLHRYPFFRDNSGMSTNQEYMLGFSAYLRQKYYKRDRDQGMMYWAQELRYSNILHKVNYIDGSDNVPLQVNENLYSVSVLMGDRLLKDAGKRGWTLDIFGGIGVGFRTLHRNYQYNVQEKDMQFRKLKFASVFVPVRIGFSIGYLF